MTIDNTKEADDIWAKERGYILQRDSCDKCKARWDRGDKTALGETMFCSAAHAYEVSYIKKDEKFISLREKLLRAINTDIMNREEAEAILDTIEERYY